MANAMPEYGGTVLRPGASGPDIALVQRWLGGLNVDGRYGTSTETAVRRFQREQGLKIDGHVGRDTWDALYRAWADKNGEGEIWPGVTMRRGSRGATVKSAQQKLKTLVPELTTDGRYRKAEQDKLCIKAAGKVQGCHITEQHDRQRYLEHQLVGHGAELLWQKAFLPQRPSNDHHQKYRKGRVQAEH